jgi:hypothetical protein
MNTDNYLRNKFYRAGLAGGGALFALSCLGPVFEKAAPFLPLIVTVVAALAAGLLVKAVFNALVNNRINQSYRHSAGGGSGAPGGQQPRQPKPGAGQAPPKHEPPPPPPDSKVMYRKILGLGEGYTADELKAAYRDCAAKFHPDRYVNASEGERRRAEEMMKNINEAYHALL